MTTEQRKEIRERAERATPGKLDVERLEGINEGYFRYEILTFDPNEKCLIAFYEDEHKPVMRAKFNAELFAHARTDILALLDALDEAEVRLMETQRQVDSAISRETYSIVAAKKELQQESRRFTQGYPG